MTVRRRSVLGRLASRGAPRLLLVTLAMVLGTASLAVLPAPVASAATLSVTNCSDSGSGSLRGAVSSASAGDTIAFSVSCPPGSPILLTSGPITISKNLTISGPGANQLAVSGGNTSQVFIVDAGVTATISGITVEDGAANAYCLAGCSSSGGGIDNSGTLTLTDSTVTDSNANAGCDLSCGAAGGGIENESTGILALTDSTVSGSSANIGCTASCGAAGGGIENLGTLTLTDSTLSGNTADAGCDASCGASGGGLDNQNSATIDASTVSGNEANNSCSVACGPTGGGINNGSTAGLLIENSTVADNSANTGCDTNCGAFGGGIFAGGAVDLTNSTLWGNSVSGGCSSACGNAGGGIDVDGTVNFVATIVADSSGGADCAGVPSSDSGYNLDDDGSCGFTAANHSFSDTPSGLDPAGPQDNGGPTETVELQATSVAVDKVAAADCPSTDQRGFPRLTPCDIGAYDTDGSVAYGSQVHDVIEVETSPAYADDPVNIDSQQLENSCIGGITFETLQQGSTRAPRTGVNSISTYLDDDGNVTVIVDGQECSPGTDLIEADLIEAPYLTATTELVVQPPNVTAPGVSDYPSTEVETGNSPDSGNSDVYTVFYVETDPVYADQPVEISSAQLDNRCGQGWRWEPGVGAPINQASGTIEATGTLDNDGNAEFVFKGASCAPGTSTVVADVEAGTHPTYTTSFTVVAPQVTLPTGGGGGTTTTKKGKGKGHKHGHKPVGTTPAPTPPAMIVTASPDPLVETGLSDANAPTTTAQLNITKSDDAYPDPGSSNPPTLGEDLGCDPYLTYTITVTNSGTSAVNGVVVTDSFSTNTTDFSSDTYSSTTAGGASDTNPSGTGAGYNDIHDTVDLPSGSSIVYTVDAVINFDSFFNVESPSISNTATITPPTGTTLSTPPSNTSATDQDVLNFSECG
ncbi:MAG TPA: choice-of-anchor Q domain-containing protein [Acidimicrobiales bacterium]|nr:choice-of-anchor Q domain-containing protein [Acidimicrobiales bacterium]